jgi:hypothetical protein
VRRSRAGAEKSSGVRVIYFNRLSNPLLAHFRLPIAPEHFARWLTLFAEAANEVMTAPHAALAVRKANLNSVNMKRVIASRSAEAAAEPGARSVILGKFGGPTRT